MINLIWSSICLKILTCSIDIHCYWISYFPLQAFCLLLNQNCCEVLVMRYSYTAYTRISIYFFTPHPRLIKRLRQAFFWLKHLSFYRLPYCWTYGCWKSPWFISSKFHNGSRITANSKLVTRFRTNPKSRRKTISFGQRYCMQWLCGFGEWIIKICGYG